MPLSDARLARMRARANKFLAGTAVIEYPTSTSDSLGGWTDAWTTRGTVDAYLQARGVSQLSEISGRLESFTEYLLFIAHDGSIAVNDRVTYDSRTYRVESVIQPDTWRAYLTAALTLEDT